MRSLAAVRLFGLSVRDHDAATLARFTLPRETRAERLSGLAAALGTDEVVYLATCNRVEVLFRAGEETVDRDVAGARIARFLLGVGRSNRAVPAFREWSGEAAVAHLYEVAAGLDSALVGEREIQGQLRQALAETRAAGTGGELLDFLVEEALRVARRVHRRTQLGVGRVSLAEIAGELVLDRVRRTPSPVVLVGVTAMTRRCGEILRREQVPLVVANRTLGKAEALVAELGAGASLALDELRSRPPRAEALVCATGAPGAVLDRAALERLAAHAESGEPPLVVDLAVPPDVDPETARAVEIERVGMDEIASFAAARRESRRAEAAAARCVVDEAIADLDRRLAERALAPVVARIHRRYRETAAAGVDRLLAAHGEALAGSTREALAIWAETLARRLAHLPARGLRALAAEHGMAAVRSFLSGGDARGFADLAAGEDPESGEGEE